MKFHRGQSTRKVHFHNSGGKRQDNLQDIMFTKTQNMHVKDRHRYGLLVPGMLYRGEKGGIQTVGRGEQGEARPAIRAPRGGPHLDLERLRLKTWSKSDFSIAETTGPTYPYIYLYIQGGLMPALAPRMPVIPRMYGMHYR